MRIKSKYHDYYDAGQALGQDQSMVFVRTLEEYVLGTKAPLPPARVWLKEAMMAREPRHRTVKVPADILKCDLSPGLVLFAGKLYPFVAVTFQYRSAGSEPQRKVSYDEASLTRLLQEANCELPAPSTRRLWFRPERINLEEFFKLRGSEELLPQAIEHKIAIACIQFSTVTLLQVNPVLKPLEFFRCLDAWQAFQELTMFIGNLCAPEKQMVEVSDKFKVAKHGFDRWSFRTPPQG